MKETEKQKEKALIQFGVNLSALYILFGILGFVLIMLPMIFYSSDKLESVGIVGDAVGGILNPVIAIPATLLTFLAFWVQYKANEQQKKDIAIQRFENVYFEMIRLHKENINEMKITGYGLTIEQTLDVKEAVVNVSRIQHERVVEGRKVFVSMAKELVAAFEFCQTYNKVHRYEKKDILELAYKIFFFGSSSNIVSSEVIDRSFIGMVKDQLKIVRNKHKDSVGVDNTYQDENGKEIKLHIKYAPFTGHESRLGHYYRHLYSAVKYVVKKEKEGLFDYNQSREYLKILRAQMSNDEQLLLYYNYRIGFGENWDYLGGEGNQFLTKYRMLHNLPVNRVKYAEDPRKHFSIFIESIKDDNDPLFEWGDYEV